MHRPTNEPWLHAKTRPVWPTLRVKIARWKERACMMNDDDDDDDDDEIAYFTVRWKTRASFVYRTKNMR